MYTVHNYALPSLWPTMIFQLWLHYILAIQEHLYMMTQAPNSELHRFAKPYNYRTQNISL